MKKTYLLFIVAMASILLTGCGHINTTIPTSSPSPAIETDDNTFAVQLYENPSTGYEWTYTMDQDGIIELVSTNTISDKEDVDGAGYKLIYEFKGVTEGDVTVTFNYQSLWETDEPDREKIYELHVNDSGCITAKAISE